MTAQTKTRKSKQSAKRPAEPATSLHKAGDAQHTLLTGIDVQLRHRMIAEAAYYMAASRGFVGGSSLEDWLKAEEQIDNKLLG